MTNRGLATYDILNPLPDDAGHLITVNIDDGLRNLNLVEGREVSNGFAQHYFNFLIIIF